MVLRMIQFLSSEFTSKSRTKNRDFHQNPIPNGGFRRTLERIKNSNSFNTAKPGHPSNAIENSETCGNRVVEKDKKEQPIREGIEQSQELVGISWFNGLYSQSILMDIEPNIRTLDSTENGELPPQAHDSYVDNMIAALSHGEIIALEEEYEELSLKDILNDDKEISESIKDNEDREFTYGEVDSYMDNSIGLSELKVNISNPMGGYIKKLESQDLSNISGVTSNKENEQVKESEQFKDNIPLTDDIIKNIPYGRTDSSLSSENGGKEANIVLHQISEDLFIGEGEVQNNGESQSNKELPNNEKIDFNTLELLAWDAGNLYLDVSKTLDRGDPLEKVRIISELADKVLVALRGDDSELEIQIKPEHLGKLVLKVALEDGNLMGKIITSNDRIKDFLNMNLEDLKTTLEDQGFVFTSLDVDVGSQQDPHSFSSLVQLNPMGARVHSLRANTNEDENEIINNQTNLRLDSSQIDYLI